MSTTWNQKCVPPPESASSIHGKGAADFFKFGMAPISSIVVVAVFVLAKIVNCNIHFKLCLLSVLLFWAFKDFFAIYILNCTCVLLFVYLRRSDLKRGLKYFLRCCTFW